MTDSRTPLAISLAILLSFVALPGQPADAAGKGRRIIKSAHAYKAPSRTARRDVECERAEHADRTGVYAGYPCWARDSLSQGGWSLR